MHNNLNKIIKILKIFKYIILSWFILTNFLLSNDFRINDNFDEISKILYEPKIINNYIKYPDLAMNFSISGTSTALFVVNKEGKIKDIKIEKSLGIAFDRQILDGLNEISKKFCKKKNIKQIIFIDFQYTLKINIGNYPITPW